MTCDFMQLVLLEQFDRTLQKYIRLGITIFKVFIWGCIVLDIDRESCYIVPLVCRLKNKFLTVYETICLPKWNYEYSFPLN